MPLNRNPARTYQKYAFTNHITAPKTTTYACVSLKRALEAIDPHFMGAPPPTHYSIIPSTYHRLPRADRDAILANANWQLIPAAKP